MAEGLQSFQNGDIEAAELVFLNVLQEQPKHPQALHGKSLVLHSRGDRTGARLALVEAISVSPHVAGYHNNLGCILFEEGEDEEAQTAFYRALKIDPTLSDAYRNLKWFLPRPNRDAEQVPLSQYLDEVTRLHEAGKVETQDRVFSALRELTIVPPQDMMGHLIARCVANWELCVSWVSQAMPSFYNERAMLEVILKAFRAQRQHAAALAAGQRLTVLVPDSASYQFNCALLAQAAGARRQAVVGFLRRAWS